MTVSGTPRTLADLRAALRERCRLDQSDPRATDTILDPIIREAVAKFDLANPHPWPWLWKDSGWQTLLAGTGSYLWSVSSYVEKVDGIFLSNTDATWQWPLERRSRPEQLHDYPLDSEGGQPRSYALMAFDLYDEPSFPVDLTIVAYLRPVPNTDYRIRITGWSPSAAFIDDTDPNVALDDLQIDDWSQTVLEYAASLVFRAVEDLSDAIAAQNVFNADVLGMRRNARRMFGAGIPGRAGTNR